jgi:hypothetical protein
VNRYFRIVEIKANEFIKTTGEDLYCCQSVVPTSKGVFVAVDGDQEYEISIPLDCFDEEGGI